MRRDNSITDIERLLDQLRADFDTAWTRDSDREPTLDLVEYDDEYVVTVDLPGYEKDDVHVRLDDRRLVVDAEQSTADEEAEDGRYLRRERRHATATEEVDFPHEVDDAGATAHMTNGVLTVTVPKASPEAEGRELSIE